jgi:hypothetical protein
MEMSTRVVLTLALCIVSLFGCSLPTVEVQTPEILPGVTETPFQPAEITPLPELVIVTPAFDSTPTASPRLTLEQLQNAEYRTIGLYETQAQTYRLENGLYRSGTDSFAEGYMVISLGQPLAHGDLDADGQEDAAILLTENYGGTGQFILLGTVLNREGQPFHAASYFLGDRVMVNNIFIENGQVIIEAVVHGPQDGACCPTVPAQFQLRLLNQDQLVVTRFTSKTPTGQERAINIRAPLNDSEVSGTVTITGDVTIAPFENNLTYTVYDSQYQPIAQGYITVDAPDLGAPGTFALTIDLAALGHTGDIYVEITDLSAADGSVLALAQLHLKAR